MGKDKYQDISDKELLQRFWQTQNNEWLGILLQRYTLLLLGVCMKYLKEENDARDCVQQIFLKVIQEAGKYKIDYFKSWLYMVAKNQCLTILRDKKGKISVELDDTNSHIVEEVESTADGGMLLVSDEVLREALQELNEEQYKCVTLFYLQKKSYQEISESTGYPMLKVKSHIQNGKRNLKISIQKKMKAADSTHAR
ncbi:sigma-70 family RNA polymerase sigma factor [Niabella yanshanensis]|uniref:Sigma-70 family RNA polymerase sigma factor n=1 Tax=Niabella yanshanensis TaxID=577386 RepID=A0ABZ0WC93_9BACT|nr:sigma-70 family RNA polymerase sigma factor [Niabella yanshanensis]WQD40363.1 sigma-70 family RNA polymerase sigma factor [Niabella yanshanensis]